MWRSFFYLVVLGFLAGPMCAEEPVYFADEDLQAAVEEQLWVSDPTPTDMLALTSLSAVLYGITDVTGLEYAVNLQDLCLRHNGISNVSPLAGLTALEELDLSRNRAADLTPLSGLTNLRSLDVHDNGLSDISPLAGLSNLQKLVLHENAIDDLSSLCGMADLRYLDVFDNHVTCISVLSGLGRLEELLLMRNEIGDISALASLTSLVYLDLRENPLNDDAFDIHLPQIRANNPGIIIKRSLRHPRDLVILSGAGGVVVNPGEGRFAYEDGEVVRLEAKPDPGFIFARWSGSMASARTPIDLTMDQDHCIQANFRNTPCSFYVDDDAHNDPEPGSADVSDPLEDGTIEHPFDCIQEAVEVAEDAASIIVRPGLYRENITLLGKSLQLLGADLKDPNDPGFPLIEGADDGPAVTFASGESPDCLLMGFVITRSEGNLAGAIYCDGSSPTIANCLVVGNRATGPNGAAIYCTGSEAVFVNCTVSANVGGKEGGGLFMKDSNVIVTNSILWANTPREISVGDVSEPSITYTNIAGDWPGLGNSDLDPLFARRGYWVDAQEPNIEVAPDTPNALWRDGDYHLQSEAGRWDPETETWVQDQATSPCIDAGDPAAPIGPEPTPNGAVINLGAYGGTPQASISCTQD
jgi:internalin A